MTKEMKYLVFAIEYYRNAKLPERKGAFWGRGS